MKTSSGGKGAEAWSCLLLSALALTFFMGRPLCAESLSYDWGARSKGFGQAYSTAMLAGQGGDLYAVIVGLSRYCSNKIPALTVSDKDARDFARFLNTQRDLFRRGHIRLLTNENATYAEVKKKLYYWLPEAKRDDTVIIFLSGHGSDDSKNPGEFFFLTHDSDPDYLATQAIHMNRQWFLEKLDSQHVAVFVDACHAGAMQMRTKGAKSLPPSFQRFNELFEKSPGKVLITSSRADQISTEKEEFGNSVFTYHLIHGLMGEADHDPNDGIVTLKEVFNYVYNRTKEDSKGYQSPQVKPDIREGDSRWEFPLAMVAPSAPPSEITQRASVRQGEVERLENLVRGGSVQAAFDLGKMYEEGRGAERNLTRAVGYYTSAGDDGNSEALFRLGRIYEYGRESIQRNVVKALSYYARAAKLGHLRSKARYEELDAKHEADKLKLFVAQGDAGPGPMLQLGRMYLNGVGVPRDLAQAAKWCIAADKAMYTGYAKSELCRLYRLGADLGDYFNRIRDRCCRTWDMDSSISRSFMRGVCRGWKEREAARERRSKKEYERLLKTLSRSERKLFVDTLPKDESLDLLSK